MGTPKISGCSVLSAGIISLAIAAAVPAQDPDFLKPAQPLPIGRAFHGSAVLKDFIYVFGGATYKTETEDNEGDLRVQVARIQPDGSLSQWMETTPIPDARHYVANTTVVLNDTVYVLGGSSNIIGGTRTNTIIYSRPLANGHLEPWRHSPPVPEAATSVAAGFSTAGFLHLTGGLPGGQILSDKVWSIPILPDGAPGNWEPGPKLPYPLWYHSAAVVGGRAYIWGGLLTISSANPKPSRTVISAPVLNTGRLGAWRQEPGPVQLPVAYYSASSATAGPYLFSFSPRYIGNYGTPSNDVWWTMVTPQGLQPWQRRTTNIPIKLYHAVAPDYRRGMIHIMGGKAERETSPGNRAFSFKLSPQAAELAQKGWLNSEIAHANSVSTAQMGEATVASADSFAPVPTDKLPGFVPFDTAKDQSGSPMVLYFRMPTAKPCIEQETTFADTSFSPITQRATFTALSVSEQPQLAQQHGIFRVPTWVFFDSNGMERGRAVGKIDMVQLQAYVAALK